MTSRQNKNRIVSQGGLTSPKLFGQGLDSPNRGRIKRRRTAGANQLHKCHTWDVKCRNYITPESVAYLSHSQNQRESSVAIMFYRISCRYVTVAKMSRQCGNCVLPNQLQIYHVANMSRQVAIISLLQICHTVANMSLLHKCHVAEMSHCCKNVTVAKMSHMTTPLRWKMTPLRGN